MIDRFNAEQLDFEIVTPVADNDPRIDRPTLPQNIRRNCAIMWSHLDMLRAFLQSENEYGIFCEDDIHIRKECKQLIPEIILNYRRRNLEILLLGYLLPYKPIQIKAPKEFPEHGLNLTYHSYPEETWGSQMYLLNRKTATKFLDIYTVAYSEATVHDTCMTPFSPDWTLTKFGRRALVYPMLAVEMGTVVTRDVGHVEFHKRCHVTNYNENFI
jgi:GR25 family glycosyltransferase involved in LPS biosynthesis